MLSINTNTFESMLIKNTQNLIELFVTGKKSQFSQVQLAGGENTAPRDWKRCSHFKVLSINEAERTLCCEFCLLTTKYGPESFSMA